MGSGYKTRELSETLRELAVRALLYEVSATIKPGLVDRMNCGAHTDMDFYTFVDSGVKLGQYFGAITESIEKTYERGGVDFKEANLIFEMLKYHGQRAEQMMLEVTKGINTHKGAIFSFGLITGASMELLLLNSRIEGQNDKLFTDSGTFLFQLRNRIQSYMIPEMASFFKALKEPHTYGEKQYLSLGLTGARGEAASGYESIFKFGLPALKRSLNQGLSLNDAMVQTLLSFMAHVEDSNVMGRRDRRTLEESQAKAHSILSTGGMECDEGKKMVINYDAWCIRENISHGGCADLMAATVFLHLIENKFFEK